MVKIHWLGAGVVALCLVVLGAVGAAAVLWDDPPDILASPTVSGTAPVTQREFDDSQLVALAVTVGAKESLLSATQGILTKSSCAVGAEAVSGKSLFSVDGVAVVSLATGVPMWRDITWGDSGEDVRALASELARLGRFDGDVKAKAGWGLVSAFHKLAVDLGTPSSEIPEGVVPVSQIAWLPRDSVLISSCDGVVGAPVTVGQSLVGFDTPVVSARITTDLSRFTPGTRTLMLDGQAIATNEDGTITDPQALRALSDTQLFKFAVMSDSLSSLQGKYVLTEPLTVSVIPPAAINATQTGEGCVIGDGEPMRIIIVSSELGQSFVTFEGSPPSMVALNPPRDLVCP